MAAFLNLQTPTNELVSEYIEKFNNNERYFVADQAIISLFEKFAENKRLEDILLKISVINDLYSTNIFATFLMAKHIQQLDIDLALRVGDPLIVAKISVGHGIRSKKNAREIDFYSFATKYCSWHYKDTYPIYDSFVHKMLVAYRKRDSFSSFSESELKDYGRFKDVIADFKEHYSLNQHDLKQIDKFLWIYGKTIFKKKSTDNENLQNL